jgi:hypothetical protein
MDSPGIHRSPLGHPPAIHPTDPKPYSTLSFCPEQRPERQRRIEPDRKRQSAALPVNAIAIDLLDANVTMSELIRVWRMEVEAASAAVRQWAAEYRRR